MSEEEKREFLRRMAQGIQDAQDKDVNAGLLLFLGLSIVLIVAVALIFKNREKLRRAWIRFHKKMQGSLIQTNRYRIRVEVVLEIPGYDGELLKTTTTNLSANGMFIKINPPLSRGEKVRFHLVLDSDSTISGEFQVSWVQDGWSEHHPTGVGVKFLNMPEAKTNLIRAFIQKRKPKRAS